MDDIRYIGDCYWYLLNKIQRIDKMAKKTVNKPTLCVTLDPKVIEELKAIAKAEQRSVSQIVQWALVQYFPIIRGGMNDPNHYSLEKMVGRLYSALTTSDMLQCGVHPTQINFDPNGQISIQLKQEVDESGKPKPLTLDDMYSDDETTESEVEPMPPKAKKNKPNPIFDVLKKKKKPVIKRSVKRV